MPISRPFAYNTGSTISGTIQVGDLAIGTPNIGFQATGLEWWNGADEDLGYVIAGSVPDDSQPTPISGVTASVQFWRSIDKTEASFIEIANYITGQSFGSGNDASTYLTTNGYWNSWVLISPTPTPTSTPTPTPTITPTNTPTPTPSPSPQAASISYGTTLTNVVAASTYNFTSPSSYGNGFVVLAIAGISNFANTISSVTIGGVAATQLSLVSGGSFNNLVALYGARIVGTTNSYTVNYTGTRRSCAISIYTVTNLLSETPISVFTGSVAQGVGFSIIGTLFDLSSSGVIIGATNNDASSSTTTWSVPSGGPNVTENYDLSLNNLGNISGCLRGAPNNDLTIRATFSLGANSLALGTWIALR